MYALMNQFQDCIWAILVTLLGLPLYMLLGNKDKAAAGKSM